MADSSVKVVFHYNGTYKLNSKNVDKYIGGRQHTREMDTDLISVIELYDIFTEIIEWDSNKTLTIFGKRKQPRVLPNFYPLVTDHDIITWLNEFKGEKHLHVYAILEDLSATDREEIFSEYMPLVPQRNPLEQTSNTSYPPTHPLSAFHHLLSAHQIPPYPLSALHHLLSTHQIPPPLPPATVNTPEEALADDGERVCEMDESEEFSKSDSDINSVSSYHAPEDDSSSNDDSDDFEEETFERGEGEPSMIVGSTFTDINAFRDALRAYCVQHHFGCRFIHNEKRITVVCRKGECSWRLHASRLQDRVTYQVKVHSGEHNCEAINLVGNNMATQDWVCNRITEWVQAEPKLAVKAIRARVKQLYSVDLNYFKIYRAKNMALEKIYGNTKESFLKIPSLYKELLERNPGSIVKYNLRDDGSFHRFFVSFKACIDGFKAGCRPLLGLDGCHLKSKYEGILLGATALDANFGLFPVAFAIVDSKTGYQWNWFLESLKEGIGLVPNLTFMSDRAKGLIDAVQFVFPQSEHRFCMTHFYKNFKKKHPGQGFQTVLWQASRAYVKEVCNAKLDRLKQLTESGYGWVVSQNTHSWSRCSYGEGAKCHYITNNMAESFNNFVGEDRYKSYVDLIDSVRQKLMVKLDHRRRHAQKWQTHLVPKVRKYVQWVSKEATKAGNVYRSGDHEAEVDNGVSRSTVDLEKKTCSCRLWQVSGLPCIHAAATILVLRRKVEDYVSEYFFVDKYMAAYSSGKIAPMPDKSVWQSCNEVVLPPYTSRKRGRPKKNRIKDIDEPSSSGVSKPWKTCGRCGAAGHNRRRCDAPINPPPSATPSSSNTNSTSRSITSTSRGGFTLGERGGRYIPVRGGRVIRSRGGNLVEKFVRSTQ